METQWDADSRCLGMGGKFASIQEPYAQVRLEFLPEVCSSHDVKIQMVIVLSPEKCVDFIYQKALPTEQSAINPY